MWDDPILNRSDDCDDCVRSGPRQSVILIAVEPAKTRLFLSICLIITNAYRTILEIIPKIVWIFYHHFVVVVAPIFFSFYDSFSDQDILE